MYKVWLLAAVNKTILVRFFTIFIQTDIKYLRAEFYWKYAKINYISHFLNLSKLNFPVCRWH